MNDFSAQEYGEAFAALSAQNSALGRYGAIVSEQCSAVEVDDLDRVEALAGELDLVIAELEVGGRRLLRFQRRVQRSEVSGPCATALRRQLRVLAESAAAIEQVASGLIRQLSARRNVVGAELVRLDQQQRAVARYDVSSEGGGGLVLVNATG
jgi:hypothetical protein